MKNKIRKINRLCEFGFSYGQKTGVCETKVGTKIEPPRFRYFDPPKIRDYETLFQKR